MLPIHFRPRNMAGWVILLAMKTHSGSIHRKGSRLYLVVRIGGRQKWLALKTGKLALARTRAAQLAPTENGERQWLKQLMRLGEAAREELFRRDAANGITWDNIWDKFNVAAQPPVPEVSQQSYKHWLELLAVSARKHLNGEGRRDANNPADLSPAAASDVAANLRASYISADRMLIFFRRVWRTLLHDDKTWSGFHSGDISQANMKSREYYRRLSVQEVRAIVEYLTRRADDTVCAALADMVVIGYYTGLRLSDVAELERSEISFDGAFLHIQPNKLRHSKHRILTIPLIGQARARVKNRLDLLAPSDRFLFQANVRTRPSRRLGTAFRACGVLQQGNGRASFHSLRATFISLMDEAGIPPHVTDAITGHSGGGMHARYTQPSAMALTAAVSRALPPL